MELQKKDVIIIGLSFCLLFTSGISILLLYSTFNYDYPRPPQMEVLVIGMGSGPNDLDPTDSWDSTSNNVIEQVVETLFTYDTRQFVVDETMPRINWLATGYSWDVTNTILTVDIRTGVRFHDGTLMDAAAVAWNFNRFIYLMNHTGELSSDERAVKIHSLYEFPDGTPIFESVITLDSDTVVFTLTAPYAPILDAMCYISCGILSPASTPATEIIDWRTGDIVGTGPYEYDYYIMDTEVKFTRFDEYWATATPYNLEDPVMFDAMVYAIIDNTAALNYAMLAGDIDIIFGAMNELLPTFGANPFIKVHEVSKPGLEYHYLVFNNKIINVTWRKAMSYAIDYDNIINNLLEGRAYRAYSVISSGYGDAFNSSLTNPNGGSAYYNLTIARQTILDGLGNDPRIDPRLQANDTIDDPLWLHSNFVAFNYSYNLDNQFRADLYPLLNDSFADIGIELGDGHADWFYFILRAYGYVPGGYDDLEIYYVSWGPDYMDPFNVLNPLFSNASFSNACQVKDFWIQNWLFDALTETNQSARNEIYHKIQSRIYTRLYCHAPIYHNQIISVHSADLYDIEYNPMERWWALPVKRNYTWVPNY
ncbi:MAG: ABC transporter substrate-binding protein [Candidatus Thorarchaeota archaeon]